jgi:hypothetical protein
MHFNRLNSPSWCLLRLHTVEALVLVLHTRAQQCSKLPHCCLLPVVPLQLYIQYAHHKLDR